MLDGEDYAQLLDNGQYSSVEEAERLEQALAAERSEELEMEMEQNGQEPQTDEPPEKEKLKRDIRREALTRLEDAARTAADFQMVVGWWDRLDANRERRERYHEVSRSGDDLPLDYGAAQNGIYFPDTLNSVLARQIQKGDFLDEVFNCPYELHELVTEEYLSGILRELSEDHKEILFLHAVRLYSSKKIGEIRGQSDRNIRKVRATLFKRIYKKLLPVLAERMEKCLPVTAEERRFLEKMKKQHEKDSLDGGNGN